MSEFIKRRTDVPPDFFATEAAGLAWLGAVEGGVPVAELRSVSATEISLTRVRSAAPSAAAARDFGRRLAITHAAGAAHFGAAPPGVAGDGYIADLALPMLDAPLAWGEFYATARVLPYLRQARDNGSVAGEQVTVVESVCARLVAGEFDAPTEPVSRIHGDLWSGNVLFSPDGVVLIDPAAHGGHRETDLAMLALFGLPHLEEVLAGYDEQAPLTDGWRDRIALHQLHPLLVHTVLFGRSYGRQTVAAAAHYA